MLRSQAIAADYETERFRAGLMAPPPACLSFCMENRLPWLVHHTETAQAWHDILDSGLYIIGANIAYDTKVAAAEDPSLIPKLFAAYAAGRFRDVLIRQKLIDIAMGQYRGYFHRGQKRFIPFDYDLGAVALRLLDRKLSKGDDSPRGDYGRLIGVPLRLWPQPHIDYAEEDGLTTWDVYWVQEEEVAAEGALEIFHDEPARTRAAFALGLASTWGIQTDAEGVEILRAGCQAKLDKLWAPNPEEEWIGLEATGLVYEIRGKRRPRKNEGQRKMSKKAAQVRMLEVYKGDWHAVKLTDTGKEYRRKEGETDDEGKPIPDWRQPKYLSVDEEACIDSEDLALFKFSQWSKTSNLLSGHVKHMTAGIHEPLHTRFDELMETGRISSSGPNITNIRRAEGARECFKPRDGYAYVGCDFDKAELHSLAQVCINELGWSRLADALNAGFDPHLGLGATLMGVSYEEAKALMAAGDERMDDFRSRAKPANFGFTGGMGPAGMVAYAKSTYDMVLTLRQAQELYEAWQEAWPCIVEYLARVGAKTRYGPCLIVHDVSRRWRGGCRYTVAGNTKMQGLCADAALASLFEVSRRCYDPTMRSPLYGSRPVNFPHDEILMETPLELVTPAALEMQRVMVDTFNTYTPDAPVSATPVAMDRWSKKARPKWSNGELQVWHYERAAA